MGKRNRNEENISQNEAPVLVMREDGLGLEGNGTRIVGDFTKLIPRLKPAKLKYELLVKAAKIKNKDHVLTAVDATAGMGEDSILLAAAGFHVKLYEYNPTIAALLRDALERASEIPELTDIVARMELHEEDSLEAMRTMEEEPDVILLDPMFPARQKSALVKKKFQLIQQLEMPCAGEEELLEAALAAHPHKIVIKRPVKGPFLAGRKPDYTIAGKAIRYDCIVLA